MKWKTRTVGKMIKFVSDWSGKRQEKTQRRESCGATAGNKNRRKLLLLCRYCVTSREVGANKYDESLSSSSSSLSLAALNGDAPNRRVLDRK